MSSRVPASLCAVLVALATACGETTRPPIPKAPGEASRTPLLSVTCEVATETNTISCDRDAPLPRPGVNADVIYGGQNLYVRMASSNVQHNPTTETQSFDATVQNLLGQPVGTPNGSTVTGVKVFFHTGPTVTQGTGIVTVSNPDGFGNFTGTNQPYHAYPQKLAPNEVSASKNWQFHMPSTVQNFRFTVLILAAFPAEQNVPVQAPETIPDAIYDEINVIGNAPQMSGLFLKNIALVVFQRGATLAERQLAVAYIGGEVVGGSRYYGDDGAYAVRIGDDGSAAPLFAAIQKLETLGQVAYAGPEGLSDEGLDYMKPDDGPGGRSWRLAADSADGDNWALEGVVAPLAWGCSTGDATTPVAVLDNGFHTALDLDGNVTRAEGRGDFSRDDAHGMLVTSVIAAQGDNGIGVAGLMWRADLRLYERRRLNLLGQPRRYHWMHDITRLALAAAHGAKVINLSGSIGVVGGGLHPREDTVRVERFRKYLERTVLDLESRSIKPLFVFSAGNQREDAYWNGFPALRNRFPGRVLVVGSTTRARSLRLDSNFGSLVEIAAPGEDVLTLDGHGNRLVVGNARTSLAAGFVTGLAGLLFSFDPALSADSVKHYILEGARRGGRVAGGIPILNAYESLKRAAERSGAPVCGNRVYATGGSIFAERRHGIASSDDKIFDLGTGRTVGSTRVFHGGHRIDYSDEIGGAKSLYHRPGVGWTAEALNPLEEPPHSYIGWRSHDGDTVVTTQQLTLNPNPTIAVRRTDPAPTTQLAVIPGFVPSGATHGHVFYPPRGSQLIAVSQNRTIPEQMRFYAVPVTGGAPTLLWTNDATELIGFVWSEDGAELAISYQRRYLDLEAPKDCWTEYRSVTGQLLRSVSTSQASATSQCYDMTSIAASVASQ